MLKNTLPERKGNFPEFGQGYPEFKSGSQFVEFGNMNALGFGGSGIDALIKSLNPIFWLDLNQISDGYFIDKSGNNKQIAAGKSVTTNDSITLPASDTDIITALTAAGLYPYFYTNDTTPKKIVISSIRYSFSSFLYTDFRLNYLALFSDEVIDNNRVVIDKARKLYFSNYYTKNLLYTFNYFNKLPTTSIIESNGYPNLQFQSVVNSKVSYVYNDNNFSFSVLKKTISFIITNSDEYQTIFNISLGRFAGDYTFSFWVLKTNIVTYLSIIIGSNIWNMVKSQMILNFSFSYLGFEGVLDEKIGDWCHFTIKNKNIINASANDALLDGYIILRCAGTGTVGSNYTIDFTDFNLINTHIDFNRTINYTPAEISPFLGKKMCVIGDSITVGLWGVYLSNLMGIKDYYNAGKSGGRMSNSNGSVTWMPTYMEEVAAVSADLYVFLVSVNDGASASGVIGGNDYSRFLDSYSYYLEFLLEQNPLSEVLLCTVPITVGGVNANGDPVVTKDIPISIFTRMRSDIYALSAAYPSTKIYDLYNLSPLLYENFYKFLPDGTHYSHTMHVSVANLLAKFIKDNY